MAEQLQIETYEFEKRKTIKGYPELHWTGKRPYESTQYFPAQLRERYGEETNGWINKIFWGDNLQVMSHLIKEYRGKVKLIYIDPPFDSKADYKKKIEIKKVGKAETDSSAFEEKQYGDIWTNDEYLQFMYERLILCKELLDESGVIYVHCDYHKNHQLRCLLDEVFGPSNFINEIVWCYTGASQTKSKFIAKHDTILSYKKGGVPIFNWQEVLVPYSEETVARTNRGAGDSGLYGENDAEEKHKNRLNKGGKIPEDWWTDLNRLQGNGLEKLGYPTQKPESVAERIIKASSNPGDIVFDCFMGSGTVQAVSMKLGRRFLGADINLGAIQTTTKRLIGVADDLHATINGADGKYTGFEVYNVNNYEFFRNPIEAKELIISALEIQKFDAGSVYDGELDGRMVKILPVNRIATKADLEELKANLPYRTFEKRKAENPNQPVEYITLVCMGHEPDLKASLEQELSQYKIDIQIVDILRDKSVLQLKREAEADIVIKGNKLIIRAFYPMNLMQKLSLQKEYVEDWKQLVESVMIDWNYDGVVMEPSTIDIAEKNSLVGGIYTIPADAGRIKVKITDVLSESLEVEVG